MTGGLASASCSDIVEDGTGQQRPGPSLAPCYDLVDAVQFTVTRNIINTTEHIT